jgi:hypothetical protein
MSLRALALLAAVAALILAAAAPASAARPKDLTLRLADVGPGYLVSDDTCLPTRLRGYGTSRVVDQIGRLPHRGCELEFWRAWVAPGAAAGPREVSSRALVFDDDAGPELALTRPRTVVSFMYLPTREELELVEPAPAIGDEAVLLRGPEERFRRRTWSSAIVLWRSEDVLAAVEASGGGSFDAIAQAALRLAVAQQARIAAPAPLSPADNDDAEVGLDAPGFRPPIFWLGHDVAAHGTLPSLSLTTSFPVRIYGDDSMLLAYGRDLAVVVGLLLPRTLHRPAVRRELRRLARDPCTRRERVALPSGGATIWSRPGRRCHARPENTFAIARLPGVRVTIAVDVSRGPIARYATRAGMLRLLRALRERAPAAS